MVHARCGLDKQATTGFLRMNCYQIKYLPEIGGDLDHWPVPAHGTLMFLPVRKPLATFDRCDQPSAVGQIVSSSLLWSFTAHCVLPYGNGRTYRDRILKCRLAC